MQLSRAPAHSGKHCSPCSSASGWVSEQLSLGIRAWARLSTVHVSDGVITAMSCRGRKCLPSWGGGHWWCKKFPTVLVFQKTVCLNRVLATSEDIPGLVCLVLFEVSSCSTLPGLCSTRYSLQRPGVILTNWVLGGEGC